MGTLKIVDVNGWRVVKPEGFFRAYPKAYGRYRRVRIGDWTGPAWQAAQYLPVGEYNFEWMEDENG